MEKSRIRKRGLGLSVRFWNCLGMRTEFSEHAEKIGEEKFSCNSKNNRAILKCELYNDNEKS